MQQFAELLQVQIAVVVLVLLQEQVPLGVLLLVARVQLGGQDLDGLLELALLALGLETVDGLLEGDVFHLDVLDVLEPGVGECVRR